MRNVLELPLQSTNCIFCMYGKPVQCHRRTGTKRHLYYNAPNWLDIVMQTPIISDMYCVRKVACSNITWNFPFLWIFHNIKLSQDLGKFKLYLLKVELVKNRRCCYVFFWKEIDLVSSSWACLNCISFVIIILWPYLYPGKSSWSFSAFAKARS